MQFYIDGVLQHQISGEVDWQQKSYNITGSGSHYLFWQYIKNNSSEEGDDIGYVDCLQWTGATEPEGWQKITYTYDPDGNRIEKTIDDDETTKYFYDGGNVIAEYEGDNNLLCKYIHGASVDQPICMIDVADSNAVYYYHFDGIGNVVALSDSAGDTVQTYEYSVYGLVAAEDPNHPNPYMFTGRRLDIETGLYYFRARYYNPYIGRFMQQDPIGYNDGVNLYSYCGNNPLGKVDPSGLLGIEDLPRNFGDPIQVKIAFYDGSDKGYDLDGDGTIDTATGVEFLEAANDFKITVNGQEYDAFFDMSTAENVGDFIRSWIVRLDFFGYEVADAYFYDHGGVDDGDLYLEFGNEEYGPDQFKSFGWAIQHDSRIPANLTFHFRNCMLGEHPDLMKKLVEWLGRPVTGAKRISMSSEERDGPDYTFTELWKAYPSPGGVKVECVWQKWRPVTLWEQIVYGWEGTVLNEEPQPY